MADKKVGPWKAGNTLFYYLSDGSSISCNCIKAPFADQIIADFDSIRADNVKLREALESAAHCLSTANKMKGGDWMLQNQVIRAGLEQARAALTGAE